MFERWYNSVRRQDSHSYWVSYTFAFVIMFAAMTASFFLKGYDLIWKDDGLTQQYTVFVELGGWIRLLLSNFFIDHTFEIPLWNSETGYGQDYLLFISNALGNPINWIAVFSTAESAQLLLNATVPITLFLAGIAFSKLCFYHERDGFSALLGSMLYLFSGVSIIAFNQIFMVYPFVLAPMIILGVDKIFDSKSPLLFIVSCALAALYSLTLIWMLSLLLLAYCIVRFVFLSQKSAKLFIQLFIRVFLCLLLGIAMAAILLVPYTFAILSLDRVGLARSWTLFYPLDYYIQIFTGFLQFDYAGSECFIGVLSLSAVAILACFIEKKDKTSKILIILFLICTVILLLPALGRVMNGFAYPNNRWTFMFALLVGYMSTYMIPQLVESNEKTRSRLIFAAMIALMFFVIVGAYERRSYLVALILFVGTAGIAYGLRGARLRLGMMLSVLLSCVALFAVWGADAASRNVPLGKAYDITTDGANSLAASIPEGDWRYDVSDGTSVWRNSSAVVNRNGTSFYNSYYNSAIDELHTKLGLTTSSLNFSVTSLDSRFILEQFAGVDYVIAPTTQQEFIPSEFDIDSGYKIENATGLELTAYISDVDLPLVFLQDQTMAYSEFDKLNPIEAQEALLQYAVVKNGSELTSDNGSKIENDIASYNEPLDFSYALTTWNQVKDESSDALNGDESLIISNTIDGRSEHGSVSNIDVEATEKVTMHLDVNLPAEKEIYVVINDVDYSPLLEATPKSSMIERLAYKLKRIFPIYNSGCVISVAASDRSDTVWQTGKDAHLYSGKDTWAFCLGSSSINRSGIDISFSNAGKYDIGSIAVYAEDVQQVKTQLRSLQEHGAQDIRFTGNRLTCDVSIPYELDESQTLVVCLPYSAGWRAYVDDQKADVVKADIGFMGLQLGSGDHHIEFVYETPGLVVGAFVSLIGLMIFIGLIIFQNKRESRHKLKTKEAR